MTHSAELLLDDAADVWVRRQWQALLDAGLPSQGRISAETNRPHITLVAAEHLHPAIDSGLAALSGRLPFPVELDGLVTFGGRRKTLALRVVRDELLDETQDEVLAIARPWITDLADHIEPEVWTPHITLARRLTADELDHARAIIDEPPAATAIRLRRWDGDAKQEKLFGTDTGPQIKTIRGL
ncbi:2'-5' RNA ligase family protein [Jongsikchunia kroppenstedtii]|uniref:2'-5' RNA ligase family protein n=1 Tax=Jongsikchunia kroppenstedtii TaxID=1121721 RepID=UPI00138B0B45|nr:2'-5' RNA ligase family protein [Jongsikchunia kroppenstedtii]